MEPGILFTAVAVPIIVSFLTSLLVHRHQKKVDFLFDYKKYILEKRKTVYDELEKLLSLLSNKNTFEDWSPYSAFPESGYHGNPLIDLYSQAKQLRGKGFWLSDKALAKIDVMLFVIRDGMDKIKAVAPSEDPVKIAIESFNHLDEYRIELSKIYFYDISHLDKIESLKNKKYLP